MFSETERVFSDTKIYVSSTRSCLGSDILEAMECLTRWAKAGVLIGQMEATARFIRAIVKVRRIRAMMLVSQTDATERVSRTY